MTRPAVDHPAPVAPPEPAALAPPSWLDARRFEVHQLLGRGGMGVVYLAFDRLRASRVALKRLVSAEPSRIYLFKQEFRGLADVAHPNLVTLYELFSTARGLYFTMEYVAGVDFRSHVRAGLGPPSTHVEATAPTVPDPAARRAGSQLEPLRPPPLPPDSVSRLRSALRQLVEGVGALHDAGKLHRDIKPSNILVTAEGRVVLLDFGLVTELGPDVPAETAGAGTTRYMSPEQASSQTLTPASDWFAVGAVLYEALTGYAPPCHRLGAGEALRLVAPPHPRDLQPELPEDLDALCMELLDARPAARPDAATILRRLGARDPAAARRAPRSPAIVAPLVGRERHLAALDLALDAVREGGGVTVYLHGEPGSGKTTLVRAFLDDVATREGALVLAGRCHESEAVPFKALDGVVDMLARALPQLPQDELAGVSPVEWAALARLFPVLGRVRAPADAPAATEIDLRAARRRAFATLREVLATLARCRRVVVAIDDLHWGDADSALLLAELMRPPAAPPLMLLTTYRTEDRATSEALGLLLHAGPLAPGAPGVMQLAVGPLREHDARALVGGLLPEAAPGLLAQLVREGGGNAFLLTELAHHVASGGSPDESQGEGRSAVDALLHARIAGLSPAAYRLLAVVAVAGQPLDADLAARIAAGGEGYLQALRQLRAGHLVRVELRDQPWIEIYHARIRDAVLVLLPAAQARAIHGQLARALEASRGADAERLAVHLLGAGEPVRAVQYGLIAARRAADTLAFHRAAKLYAQALALTPHDNPTRKDLEIRLAESLVAAGRGAEAAAHYLAAAALASREEVLELRRYAAEQQLITCHLEQGLTTLRQVLSDVGMRLPRTPARTLASLLWTRARLRLRTMLRGWRFKERPEAVIPRAQLLRLDACYTAAIGLSFNDHLRGLDFASRYALLTLRAGEPGRVVAGLCLQRGYTACDGEAGRTRCDAIERAARALLSRVDSVDSPVAAARLKVAAGLAAFLLGDRARALADSDEALGRYGQRAGLIVELATARTVLAWSLFYLGRLDELSCCVPRWLADASASGNLNLSLNLRLGLPNTAWLAGDDLTEARRHLEDAAAERPKTGYTLQSYYELLARCHLDFYAGQWAAAWERVRRDWPPLRRSWLLLTRAIAVEARWIRARAALGAAAAAGAAERPALLRVAAREGRRLRRQPMPWGRALGRLVDAAVLAQRGDAPRALVELARAEAALNHADMPLIATIARLRRGELQGGAVGQALVLEADEGCRRQAVRNPRAMANLLAPGFPTGRAM